MTTMPLVRVTVAAAHRRLDVALPQQSPVAEILPVLLRQVGAGLAEDRAPDSGWVLRRTDGAPVDGSRTLGSHGVRDGEVLHLVPRRLEWPEPEYDDVVSAIAAGAGRIGRLWGQRHTRVAGLGAAGVAVGLTMVAVLRAGIPWRGPGWVAVAVALLLLAAGVALARAAGDAGAGSVVAALALPPAFLGGALALGGSVPLTGFGAAQLLGGCALLLLAAVLGYLGVVQGAAVFIGAATVGLLGGVSAWVVSVGATGGVGSSAVLASGVLLFSPMLGPMAIRLGRVPTPVLPRTGAELVRDDPQPPRHAVYAAVLRTDSLLTGMVAGAALAAGLAQTLLARRTGPSEVVLLVMLSVGFGLRARLYPAVRHRAPMLCAALVGVGCLATGPLMADREWSLSVAVPGLIAVAAVAVLLGLVYSRRTPGAALSRYAEVLEVLVLLACAPLVCAVLGLFGLVRGFGG